MPTLDDIENNIRTRLDATGYAGETSWSVVPGPLDNQSRATVKIAQSELLDAGSNISIRTAEALVQVRRIATTATAADLATLEASINTNLEQLTAASYWSAVTGVRASPLPEIEVEAEPERAGLVISFTIRARIALEA